MQKMSSGRGEEGQAEEVTVEEAWVSLKTLKLSTAVEVCGMKQSNGQQQRMKWWNNGVKEAARK